MGVGGRVGESAVDETYSTKPDCQSQTLNYATGSYYTASY